MLARIRKSLIAGAGAGAAAGFGAIVAAGALTREEISKAIGVGVAAAVSVAWATWRVPNRQTPLATGGIGETPRNWQV